MRWRALVLLASAALVSCLEPITLETLTADLQTQITDCAAAEQDVTNVLTATCPSCDTGGDLTTAGVCPAAAPATACPAAIASRVSLPLLRNVADGLRQACEAQRAEVTALRDAYCALDDVCSPFCAAPIPWECPETLDLADTTLWSLKLQADALAEGRVAQQALAARLAADLPLQCGLTPEALVDGGNVVDASGLAVAAAAGTLAAPVDVSSTSVPAPPQALFPGATALGSYFSLCTDADVEAPESTPFIVGLPVPPGADTAHLALAALAPGYDASDGDPLGSLWFPISGLYDASADLFLTGIPTLADAGRTFVLVEHPDFSSPAPVPPAAASEGGLAAASPATLSQPVQVDCVGFAVGDCGTTQTNPLEIELATAYDVLKVQRGYREPRLYRPPAGASVSPAGINLVVPYEALLLPASGAGCTTASGTRLGAYSPSFKSLLLCMTPGLATTSSEFDELVRTAWHEFFHSIQAAYPQVLGGWGGRDDWLIEGTAEAMARGMDPEAPCSGQEWCRSGDFSLREPDVELEMRDGAQEYRVQDFWVTWGRLESAVVEDLIPIFQLGAQTADVAQAFTEPDFKQHYWDWVKNQSYEKTEDFDGGLFGGECSYIDTLFNKPARKAPYQSFSKNEPLPPLTSRVVVFVSSGNLDGEIAVNIEEQTDPNYDNAHTMGQQPHSNLRYKIYQDQSLGCGTAMEDESFPIENLSGTFYVVVANTSLDTEVFFEVIHQDNELCPPICSLP